MKGFIVYADYDYIDDQTIVKLFGRLENGQSFVTINKVTPYFFIKEKDEKKVLGVLKKFNVEKTNLKTFKDEKVVKISHKSQTEINKLSKEIHKTVDLYESDVKPHTRFIIDNNILGTIKIDGDYSSSERVDRVYNEPEIHSTDYIPEIKIVSMDIESDKDSGNLFCIGLYSKNYKKNFMITKKKLENTVSCKSEEECLIKFKEELIKFDPDIITGWNLIDFDLVHLQKLFRKYKLPFDLGRTNSQLRLRIESEFFRSSSADVPGRQVIDALNLIKDPFIKEAPTIKNADFESYQLEEVSQKLLGSGKALKGKDRHNKINQLYESNNEKDLQELVDYNLLDCKLVYDILEKTKMVDLAIERTQLTGLQLDRLTASIAAFDSLYIREARKLGYVSPNNTYQEKETSIMGGYVFSPQPGIYHNVLVMDFKSLYPSIIRTFNIDPYSYIEKPEKGAIKTPNGAYFKNQIGVLPIIIQKLHEAREKAKKEKRELSSYAIKIIMNSFFGVLASPNCRYFNMQIANSITHFGQEIIKLTAKKVEEKGYNVIYSDTDSVFIETKIERTKADLLGHEIQDEINHFYKNYVKKEYARESFLELQFEKQFTSLLIPQVRNKKNQEKETAAKKRYAGLVHKNGKDELVVVGLEAIRGDWTEAAQEFQKELLLKIFKEKEPIQFIKDYVKKIKSGELNKSLIYRKSIRKNLDEYTKTTPPHVKAARQLDHLDSNVIEYYITVEGPEPIQKLRHKLDYDHYIEKQIKPIADQILSLLGKSFDEVIKSSKQATLF